MALGGSPEYRVILLGEYGVGKTTFLNQVQRITRNDSILEVTHSDYVECAIPMGSPNKQVTVKVTLKRLLKGGRGGGGGGGRGGKEWGRGE